MVGFESFRIFDVGKTFRDKVSAGEPLSSPSIEILGFEWFVDFESLRNGTFGIFLNREEKKKLDGINLNLK